MKNMNIVLAAALCVLASGCAMKQKVLDAGAVSMTHQHLKDGQKLQEKGPVTGEFCGDSSRDKGTIGLMDEAIKSAQAQHGVDYITNAAFYFNGMSCMTVEGTGHKIVEASAVVPAAPVTTKKNR